MKIGLNSLNLLIVFSCGTGTGNVKGEKNFQEKSDDNEVPMKEIFNQDSSQTKKFINDDDFVFSVLDNELSFSYVESKIDIKSELIVPNIHNKSLNDTIVSFTNEKDFFKFHKASGNAILLEAEIKSDQYKIDSGAIKIGVPYNIFKDKFNLETAIDTLIVKDFENSSYFMFLFDENQMLNTILFKTRYLD
ncbi:hypothetical protein [Algoriphagus chordae]|uniref:Lipoprotein n=1 Tax=Algoriphagus chordae TaxID=237019 RepID=A0A2W7RQN9_9BACT|nr:hypothetical protein [Algoriphagus chordae]PZX56799.1 hypothetical protein LV85_00732 [Algoriphagus chordae]